MPKLIDNDEYNKNYNDILTMPIFFRSEMERYPQISELLTDLRRLYQEIAEKYDFDEDTYNALLLLAQHLKSFPKENQSKVPNWIVDLEHIVSETKKCPFTVQHASSEEQHTATSKKDKLLTGLKIFGLILVSVLVIAGFIGAVGLDILSASSGGGAACTDAYCQCISGFVGLAPDVARSSSSNNIPSVSAKDKLGQIKIPEVDKVTGEEVSTALGKDKGDGLPKYS